LQFFYQNNPSSRICAWSRLDYNRNEGYEYCLGSKAGRYVELKNLTTSCIDPLDIRVPQIPEAPEPFQTGTGIALAYKRTNNAT
jgi:hypothetical protein